MDRRLTIGVRFSPPMLMLEYKREGRVHRYRLALLGLCTSTNIGDLSKHINGLFSERCGWDISISQLQKLLKTLIEKSASLAEDADKNDLRRFENQDLSKLDNETLDRAKAIMNRGFERNALRPGDKGYEYDKQVNFEPEDGDASWDDEDSD